MKLRRVTFNDEGDPTDFTVTMSLDEMALLYRLAGHISPKRITELSGDLRWGNALFDLAESASRCLGRFFDDGPDDVVPRFTPFGTVAP